MHCFTPTGWHNHVVTCFQSVYFTRLRHPDRVLTEPAGNDRIVHDRLIRLVFEIAVPTGTELWAVIVVHLLELLLRRTDLNTGINTVRGKWSGAVEVPLVEYLLLHTRSITDEVIEALGAWLSTIRGEVELRSVSNRTRNPLRGLMDAYIMVLEVESNTWKVYKRLNACLTKLLCVTDSGSLKDQWAAQGATADDDLLAGPEGPRCIMGWRERFGGHSLDADGSATLEDDLLNLGVANEVEVGVHRSGAVDISVGGVRATPGVTAVVSKRGIPPLASSHTD